MRFGEIYLKIMKFQITSFNYQINSNDKNHNVLNIFFRSLGNWNFEFIWNLVLGAWNLL